MLLLAATAYGLLYAAIFLHKLVGGVAAVVVGVGASVGVGVTVATIVVVQLNLSAVLALVVEQLAGAALAAACRRHRHLLLRLWWWAWRYFRHFRRLTQRRVGACGSVQCAATADARHNGETVVMSRCAIKRLRIGGRCQMMIMHQLVYGLVQFRCRRGCR